MPLLLVLAIALVSSCGSESTQRRPSTEMDATPVYDLHEWGLVTVSSRGFELGTGPGRNVAPEEMMVVDKPILYVHASDSFDLRVEVTPGAGLSFAERWPPMDAQTWTARVSPGACRGTHAYPTACSSPDGYCEVAELAAYETDDAACLRVGEHSLPMLFYRMRHEATPAMPLAFRTEGENVVVTNRDWEGGVGGVWRVSWNGSTTHAQRVDVPARGESATLARATTNGVGAARQGLRADLATHGLTDPEVAAFMRAWDEALFGATADVDAPGDRPVAVDRRTPDGDDGVVDEVSDEEIDRLGNVQDIPALVGGPRLADVVLYWLPPRAVESLARIEAHPTPRHLRRAILVRVDLR